MQVVRAERFSAVNVGGVPIVTLKVAVKVPVHPDPEPLTLMVPAVAVGENATVTEDAVVVKLLPLVVPMKVWPEPPT